MVYRPGVMTLGRTAILMTALLTAAVLGGCTLKADENEISIEHLSTQPGVAQAMADSHCAKYAKVARRVQMGIEQAGPILGFRKKISTFECVEKGTEGQGRGSGAKGTP
ncbi:MAG: hypothetical protein CMM60_06870 [Rhodospirillaceae bacterium]|nr:hypothetical protein [Rhodospirillaceae bacterium]